jgi:hypothetical protein
MSCRSKSSASCSASKGCLNRPGCRGGWVTYAIPLSRCLAAAVYCSGGWRLLRALWGWECQGCRYLNRSDLLVRSRMPGGVAGVADMIAAPLCQLRNQVTQANCSSLPSSDIRLSCTPSFGCLACNCLRNSIKASLCVAVSVAALATFASPYAILAAPQSR